MAAAAGTLLIAEVENVPVLLALTPAPPGTTKIVPVPPCEKSNLLTPKLQMKLPTCTLLVSKLSDRVGQVVPVPLKKLPRLLVGVAPPEAHMESVPVRAAMTAGGGRLPKR